MSERAITIYPARVAKHLAVALVWVATVTMLAGTFGMPASGWTMAFAILVGTVTTLCDRLTERWIGKVHD